MSSTPHQDELQAPAPAILSSKSPIMEYQQPKLAMQMDPQRPHPEQSQQMHLRGGDRGGMCPGRFCFCVPCPIPCDFCII